MTLAAGGESPLRGGRYRLVTVILALSLALNVFFVAGAVWTRLHAPHVPPNWAERHRRMLADLDLDPKQRAAFDRYIAAIRTDFAQMGREIGPLMGSAWAELSKPQADGQKVMRLIDEVSEKRRTFLHDAATRTIEFLAVLSPEQRIAFVQIARARPHLAHPHGPDPSH